MLSARATSLATALLVAAASAALTSCREPEAGLHVQIEGALTPGVDFDRLTLVAYLASDRTPLFSEALESPPLPVTFNLVSGKGTPAGTEVEVLASAELQGEVISAAKGTATLQPAEGDSLVLTLPARTVRPDGGVVEVCDDGVDDDGDGLADCADVADCGGKSCASGGLTCVMGACRCQNGTLGVWGPPATGFIKRSGAEALALTRGPATGGVVIAGGRADKGKRSGEVELYRPGFSLDLVSAQVPRDQTTLVLTGAGEALLVGGASVAGGAQTPLPTEQVEVATNGTTPNALSPPEVLVGVNAVPWGRGWLLFGGTLGARVVELWPLQAGGTTYGTREVATLGAVRRQAAVLADGRVFFASGPTATNLTELLSPDGGVNIGPRLPVPLANAAIAPLPEGRVLLVGGEVAGTATPDAYIIEAQGEAVTFRQISPMNAPHGKARAYPLSNGWVYLEPTEGTAAAQWFDFASQRFVPATPPPTPTARAAIAPFSTRVFRVGGETAAGNASDVGGFIELQCAP